MPWCRRKKALSSSVVMFQRVYSQHIQVRIPALREGFSRWKKLYYDSIKEDQLLSQFLVEVHY